ncbi:MAG: hypothetical protein HKP58_16030 [Desulfatitalea sp.]|nr:hypothetical protein [Desulfatitalea sp.]NNK01921.1 hypothetical protein [Desulfatitalea sp.]
MQVLIRFMARLEQLMVAVAFAEAGCWDTARGIMAGGERPAKQRLRPRVCVSDRQRPTLRM